MLSGLVLTVTHLSELEHFLALLHQAEPAWLIVATLLQGATYFSVAAVWLLALRFSGNPQPLTTLVPLAVAKLFSDRAMPSGGLSGTAFFVAALQRRGVDNSLCMATLLLHLVTYYGAYLLAALATVLLLFYLKILHPWIMLVVIIFSLVAIAIPLGALWLGHLGQKKKSSILLRIPPVAALMKALANAPRELLHRPSLVFLATLMHSSVFVLDATTFWIMLKMVSQSVPFSAVFTSFMVASMVATIGPIPLGLGTFEVTSVSMLGAVGVPIEAALASTLLLRGFTLWLPLLPGMWLARRALK